MTYGTETGKSIVRDILESRDGLLVVMVMILGFALHCIISFIKELALLCVCIIAIIILVIINLFQIMWKCGVWCATVINRRLRNRRLRK